MAVDPLLLEYYSNLLIAQYKNQPNMVGTTQLLVNQSLCDGLPQALRTCFNLSTAVGAQLDIIGRIVGVPRNIMGLDLNNTFFSYTNYAGSPAANGFGSYTDVPYPTNLFRSYFDNATYTLTDYQLQQLIYLKIIYNNTYSSTKNIVQALWTLYGDQVSYVDNANMTIDVFVFPPLQTIFTVAAYLDIIPRPMGVGLNVVPVSDFLYDQQGNILYDQQMHALYAQQGD